MRPMTWRCLAPLLTLTILAAAAPGAALDTVYLVRHAEKVTPWPDELDPFRPLTGQGSARAERWAEHLADAGIAAVYSSPTTRTLATGMPLAQALGIPIHAERATIDSAVMGAFLHGLAEAHAGDTAVLIVGHSNTIPLLLAELGAEDSCFAALGIRRDGEMLLISGNDGLWRVDLAEGGCAGARREVALAAESVKE